MKNSTSFVPTIAGELC